MGGKTCYEGNCIRKVRKRKIPEFEVVDLSNKKAGRSMAMMTMISPLKRSSETILLFLMALDSLTFCNCSRGWLMESFKTVVGKPVKVKREDSIMRADRNAVFRSNFKITKMEIRLPAGKGQIS